MKLRACRVVALCNVQLSARDARLTNKGAVMGEAAVLVSRRTARRATHFLPAERLRDNGYLGPVTQKHASVFTAPLARIETELVPKRQP